MDPRARQGRFTYWGESHLGQPLRFSCIILICKLKIITLNMAVRVALVTLAGKTANSIAKMFP